MNSAREGNLGNFSEDVAFSKGTKQRQNKTKQQTTGQNRLMAVFGLWVHTVEHLGSPIRDECIIAQQETEESLMDCHRV